MSHTPEDALPSGEAHWHDDRSLSHTLYVGGRAVARVVPAENRAEIFDRTGQPPSTVAVPFSRCVFEAVEDRLGLARVAETRQHASRRAQVGVRFTATEITRLEQAARKAGLTVTELVRQRASKGRITVRHTRALDWTALDQLRRIGVNLNQAVRLGNATGFLPPEVARAAAVEDFLMKEVARDGP